MTNALLKQMKQQSQLADYKDILGFDIKSCFGVGNFCGLRSGDTSEPAVNQVSIRHNRSLRSLLFRLPLDSRRNLTLVRLLPALKEKNEVAIFSFKTFSKTIFGNIFWETEKTL